MATLVIDSCRRQIEELALPRELSRARKAAFSVLKSASQRRCVSAGIDRNTTIDPMIAYDLLRDIHADVAANLESLANGFSSVRWLFMLRRLPEHVFCGRLASTAGYDTALAEVISARSTHVENIREQNSQFSFSIDGGSVRRLLRFCEGVRTLSEIHVLVRWCGKGAHIRIDTDWFPRAEQTNELREDIQLYDRRCEDERSSWAGAGTVFFEDSEPGDNSILVADRVQPQLLELPDGSIIRAIARPRIISLTDVKELTRKAMEVSDTPWPTESALALWVARAAWYYFVQRFREFPVVRQIVNSGYLFVSEELFKEWIASVSAACNAFVESTLCHPLRITSADDLISAAGKYRSEVWPLLPRDLIRKLPGMACVDLCTASHAISDSFVYTEQSGSIANVRSKHFERAVQQIIDETTWRPTGEARGLIGLTLKKDSRVITDIDSVATDGATLILVSCKSRLKASQYDMGEYTVVRNASTAMKEAKTEWQTIVDDIRSDPSRYNFDFSTYSTIVGVVCTSSVFFAPATVILPQTPSDVRLMAVNELRTWLAESETGSGAGTPDV